MPGPLSPRLRSTGQSLWKPGQCKPQCPLRINWDHPLAMGLVSYWIDTGNGVYVDLVTVRFTATVSNNTSIPAPAPSLFGNGFKYSAIHSEMSDPAVAIQQSWTAPYSVAAGILPQGASNGTTPNYFGLLDASGNDAINIYAPTTTTFGISFANTAAPSNFTYTAGTFYAVVGAATGPTAQSVWVNGIAQTAGANTSAFSGSAQHWVFNSGQSAFNGTLAGHCNAFVFFGAAWQNRALSQADAALLTIDPYCFLVPYEPEMMIIQSAVVDVLYPQIWM